MEEREQQAGAGRIEPLTCTSVGVQYADISVPIKLKPYAVVGAMQTECCGEPIVAIRPSTEPSCTCGCELVITQTVCIRIPVGYGTAADVGETAVHCKKSFNCGGTLIR